MAERTEETDWRWFDVRVRWLADQLGTSLSKLSELAGKDRQWLSAAGKRERRNGQPGTHNVESGPLEQLSRKTGAKLDWLNSGQGPVGNLRIAGESPPQPIEPPRLAPAPGSAPALPAHDVVEGLEPVLEAAGIPRHLWDAAILRSIRHSGATDPWQVSAFAVREGRKLMAEESGKTVPDDRVLKAETDRGKGRRRSGAPAGRRPKKPAGRSQAKSRPKPKEAAR